MCDNKPKLSLDLIKYHTLQTYGGALVETQIYPFLTPAINGGCLSVPRPDCSIPVLSDQKAGWAPEPDKMLYRRNNFRIAWCSQYTGWSIPDSV
jgi:hypothetical protein